MAQLIPIVSEALQTTIRRLLPSQAGFGEDLQAQNVIVPIIDLTPSAEGSGLPVDLSRSLAFGSQTSFESNGSPVAIASTPGFYRIFGTAVAENNSAGLRTASFTMSDGFSTKEIWKLVTPSDGIKLISTVSFDFNVYVAVGITLSANAENATSTVSGSIRQIATTTGELVNPAGFTA